MRNILSTERVLNDPGKIGLAIGLLNHRIVRSERPNGREIGADKHVRNRGSAMNFVNGSDTASLAQSDVDDHQVGMPPCGGDHGLCLSGFDGTDVMPHFFEHLGKQYADHGIVFHHENAERGHRCIPAARSRVSSIVPPIAL